MKTAWTSAILLAALPAALAAAPPLTMSYQGYVTDTGGVPLNGPHSFTFSIYPNPIGPPMLWTETLTGVPVGAGLFDVVLGLATPLNLPFDNTYFLGVAVDGGTELAPRTRLTASPYAINVADGRVVKSLNGMKDAVTLAAGANVSIVPSPGTLTISATPAATPDNDWIVTGDDMHAGVIGEVGIGIADPQRLLHLRGANGTLRIDRETGSGDALLLLNRYSGPESWRTFELGIASSTLGDGTFFIADLDTGTAGAGTKRLVVDDAGQVGIGLVSPTALLDVDGRLRVRPHSDLNLMVRGGSPQVDLDLVPDDQASSPDTRARIRFAGETGDPSASLSFHTREPGGSLMERMRVTKGGVLQMLQQDGTATTVQLRGGDAADQGGELELYDGSGSNVRTVLFRGYSIPGNGGGALSLYDFLGNKTVTCLGQESGGIGAELTLSAVTGTGPAATLILDAEDAAHGAAGVIKLKDLAGTSQLVLTADYNGTGDSRVVTDVLEINGGSDLSERFEVGPSAASRGDEDDAGTRAEPGMVVRISSDRPGALVVADRAYDRRVAGVISGAGGVQPGMLMGQNATVADGDLPVALTGRVYCRVDASYGAIEPGDLLTTSDTPGHAMRVGDQARAQGAILGKALTGLRAGRGLVLVLVALQ